MKWKSVCSENFIDFPQMKCLFEIPMQEDDFRAVLAAFGDYFCAWKSEVFSYFRQQAAKFPYIPPIHLSRRYDIHIRLFSHFSLTRNDFVETQINSRPFKLTFHDFLTFFFFFTIDWHFPPSANDNFFTSRHIMTTASNFICHSGRPCLLMNSTINGWADFVINVTWWKFDNWNYTFMSSRWWSFELSKVSTGLNSHGTSVQHIARAMSNIFYSATIMCMKNL